MPVDDTELTDWIGEAARELAEVAAIVGSRAAVPACPGWTMRQLVAHVISGLSGWYTHNLTHGHEPLDYRRSWDSQPALPRGNAERLVRLVGAADDFAQLVASLDLDAACHVFQSRRTARAWVLRAATETAVHLQDAQEVLGEITPLPPERAVTSIDETLRCMWHGALLLKGDLGATRVPDEPIVVTATDLGRTWQVEKGSDDFHVGAVDAAAHGAALSVSGTSAELVRWLWGRLPTASLAVTGDPQRIDAWNLSAHI